ncbi:MAG: TetR/AcrR family transcriptional regulator [Anaerolineaceae bacterium]|nr:TetR/AcrR family transcriptional regulator [Anaerolineaceae bacterium]
MGRPVRTEPYDLGAAVKAEAWKLITAQGADAVALRAIARALKITAPAIYNYFASREVLLAALIADADADLGRTLTDAHSPHLEDDADVQLRVVCQAYRRWGVENPQRYLLFFALQSDSPQTEVSPTLAALIGILNKADAGGRLKKEEKLTLPPGLSGLLSEWKVMFGVENEFVLYLAYIMWSRLHGLILNEIGRRYPPYIKDAGELFRLEVKTMIYQYLN